jgi:hypothetical protein
MSRDPSAKRLFDAGMNCSRVRRLLWDLVDGALPLGREQAVRRHLERCSACRHEWEGCLQAEHALASAPSHVPPPGDLRTGFYARLAAQPVPARSGLLTLTLKRAVLPALAVCLLLIVFLKAQFVSPAAPSAESAFIVGQTDGNNADMARLSPDMQAQLRKFLAPIDASSNRVDNSGRSQDESHVIASARLARSTARHHRHSGLPLGRVARVTNDVKRGGSTLPVDRRLITSDTTVRRTEVSPLAVTLPPDAGNGPISSATDAGNGTASPAEVATAAMAASGEQEVHVVDEERGFTRSARVIAAVDVNDDTPVVSVEADTTQN